MPRHLVCLAPYVGSADAPYAGHQFLHHYLERFVAEGWTVTLLAPATPGNERTDQTAGEHRRSYDVVLTPLRTRRPLTELRRLLMRRLPMERAWRPQVRGPSVDPVLRTADHVEVQWTEALPLLPQLRRAYPDVPVTAVAHDLGWQSLQRRNAQGGRGRTRQVRRSEERELGLLAAADAVLCFKQEDVELVRAKHPHPSAVRTVPPHLDVPTAALPEARTPTVLFVGAWDRPENSVSALWFLDEVWGHVLEGCPQAQLVLAGGDPPQELRARAGAGVHLTGYVPDLTPCYEQARLVVAPLRMGAGLRFKVPQALAYGRPVVCTSLGAEGVSDAPGLVVADEPRPFAAAVTRLLLDGDEARRAGLRGRAWVCERFDLSGAVQALARDRERGCRAR